MFRFWKQGDVRHHYDLKQELGKGTFSVVRLGVNKKTNKKWAVKIINKKSTNVETKKMLETEIAILQKVNHPNVIGMEAMYETKTHLFLVMEYVAGGELFDRIVERGCFSEYEAANIIRQILDAVKYLHANGIVHRDLKPENVLCDTEEALVVKIADFGLSKIVDTDRGQMLQTCCGTPSYAAPELLLCEGYGEPVDLWAVGVILYTLLSGCLPFFGETHAELFERILAGAYAFPDPEWTSISSSAKSLVSALLTQDPAERLTAEEALQHPWVQGAGSANQTQIVGHSNRMEEFIKTRKTDKAEKTYVPPSAGPQAPILGPQIFDTFDPEGEDSAMRSSLNMSTSGVGSITARRPVASWADVRDWPILANLATVLLFQKDEVILKEGAVNRDFYRIKSGSVRVEKTRVESKQVTLLKMDAPQMFGEISMLQPSGIVSASIVSDSKTEIYQISTAQLKKLLEREHDLAERFYKELAIKQSHRLAQARQKIEQVMLREGVQLKRSGSMVAGRPSRSSSMQLSGVNKHQKDFIKIFNLNDEVCVLGAPCKFKKGLMHAGMIYVTQKYICCVYSFFAVKHKHVIPMDTITSIQTPNPNPGFELTITIFNSKSDKKASKITLSIQSENDYKELMQLIQEIHNETTPQRSNSFLQMAGANAVKSVEVDQQVSDALTADDWKLLIEKSKVKIFTRNQTVIKEGDQSPQNLYQIATGRCRIEQQRPEDDTVEVLGIIGQNETFGEISFLQNSLITASVVADEEAVEVYVIEGVRLDSLFNDHPGIAGRFYKYLATLISNRLHHREVELLLEQ